MGDRVVPGIETLIADAKILSTGERVGIVCNPTGVTRRFLHLADALIDRADIEVVALFGPEHGLFSTAQDQVGVKGTHYRGVPVHSLYGLTEKSLAPADAALSPFDTLVFDIQDVGSRYYTYVWTMVACLESCARLGKRFVVCDRPNPIGGDLLEGPVLQPDFASFVGRHEICTRHGMTVGEIARMVNAEKAYDGDLTVVPCRSWKRAQWFDETGLPWVLPSPNMPTLETATVYPGGCLIEGTNLSEGRGTTCPFQIVGAPFLDGTILADSLNRRGLPGVYFRPIQFEPTFHKHAGMVCQGVFVHVTDRLGFRPVTAYVALLLEAGRLAPADFGWRTEPYEFESDRLAIDLLFGEDQTRRAIEAGATLEDIRLLWEEGLRAFRDRREPYLLYGRDE